jgi:hypothetical protein
MPQRFFSLRFDAAGPAGSVADRATQASYQSQADSANGDGSGGVQRTRNGITFRSLNTDSTQPTCANNPATRPANADPLGSGYSIRANVGGAGQYDRWRIDLPDGAGEYELVWLAARRIYTRVDARLTSEDGATVYASFVPPALTEGHDESQVTRSTAGGAEVIADSDDLLAGATKRTATLPATVYLENGTVEGSTFRSRLMAVAFEKVGGAPPATVTDSVTISPKTVTVAGGAQQDFEAVVAGTGTQPAPVFSATAGAIDAATGLFTAPAAGVSPLTITVTAAAGGKSDTATVTVPAAGAPTPTVDTIAVSPKTATVVGGGQQDFDAVLTGTGTLPAVAWAASAGAITSAGLFTAPGATDQVQTVTITGSAGGKTDTATVTVPAVGVEVDGTDLRVKFTKNGAPVAGVSVPVRANKPGLLAVPASVTTDAAGVATIPCRRGSDAAAQALGGTAAVAVQLDERVVLALVIVDPNV